MDFHSKVLQVGNIFVRGGIVVVLTVSLSKLLTVLAAPGKSFRLILTVAE